jgi:5-oxoprolinase (ATP-hydrolysing) subunit A
VLAERPSIDLNADVGEASEPTAVAIERSLLRVVTSANIACGGHAGDDESMRQTMQVALEHGVTIGAHPSYPDRVGFGRRTIEISVADLSKSLSEQIGALMAIADGLGAQVQSVKPHGALYGEVARGRSSFGALLGVMQELCGPDVALVLPSATPAVELATTRGRPVLQEGFADRAYAADGALVARRETNAVYDDPIMAAAQALALVEKGTVTAADGTVLSLAVDTLCVHGDSPNALAMANAVRQMLGEHGIAVTSPPPRRR